MYSDSGPAPAVKSLARPDPDRYLSKTLVLENIHARTTPAAILHLLARRADVDPYVLHEIRIRNVIKRGRIERHAFLEFWRREHAICAYHRLGSHLHIRCPPPRSGEVGQVLDDRGMVVYGDGEDTTSKMDSSSKKDTDRYSLSPDSNDFDVKTAAKTRIRFYAQVRVVFWKSFVGKADPACLSKQGWECAECGLPNYEKWEFCYRCGVERPWSENILYRPADMLEDGEEYQRGSTNGKEVVISAYNPVGQIEDETIDISL